MSPEISSGLPLRSSRAAVWIALALLGAAAGLTVGLPTGNRPATGSTTRANRIRPSTRLPARVAKVYGGLPLAFEPNVGQTASPVRFLARGRGYALFLTGDSAVIALQSASQKSKGRNRRPVFSRQPSAVRKRKLEIGNWKFEIRSSLEGSRQTSALSGQGRSTTDDGPMVMEELFAPLIQNAKLQIQNLAAPSPQPPAPSVVRMRVVGANPHARATGLDPLPAKTNYFIGKDPKKWRTKVPNYAKVKYEGVYPGIDLVYYGNQGQLEYDWAVAPGADPNAIAFEIAGADGVRPPEGERRSPLRIDANGDLMISTGAGEVRFKKPVAYQLAENPKAKVKGQKAKIDAVGISDHRPLTTGNFRSAMDNPHLVDGRYVLRSVNPKSKITNPKSSRPQYLVSFKLSPYDRALPLIIDPVLSYSTYLSGPDSEFESAGTQINSLAVDAAGNAYVTGTTTSTDLPTSPGASDSGCGSDGACGGQPLPDGLVTLVPPSDIFVAKFNPEGTALLYSTYLGGGLWDGANAIAVDALGNAYLAGSSNSPDYPTTAGTLQPGCGSDGACNHAPDGSTSNDAVLTKLNADGSALVYSTFLGGSAYDQANGLALDPSGNAFVGGMTTSPDFPTTSGAFRTEPLLPDCGTAIGAASCSLGFVAKVDATGTSLLYSTFLGGGSDSVTAVAADAAGHAYATGETQSATFPTTSGAFQSGFAGGTCSVEVVVFPCADAFFAELDPTGSRLVYSTYLGGVETDRAGGIAVGSAGGIYVSGMTQSSDFPTTAGAFQTALNGGDCPAPLGASTQCPDAFVAKFDPASSGTESLVYSTLLGGQGGDYGAGVTVDAAGHAVLTGTTASEDFPTVNPIQAANAGGGDAFVAELDPAGSGLVFSTYLGGSSWDWGASLAVDTSSNIYIAGYTFGGLFPGIGFPTTPGSFENGPHAGTLGFLSKIAPANLPAVILDPTVLSFADQGVLTTSSAQSVTLRNLGSAPVTISAISTTGEFSQTNDCGAGIGGGQTCSIQVAFTPSTSDLESGELRVTDNAPGSPHTATLQGNNGVTSITISPGDVSIGPIEVGETSTVETITITNTGDEPMTITNIAITGGTDFQESSNCPPSLAPGESCTISVTFTPTTAGDTTAQLDIYTDTSSLPQTVNLTGRTADFALAALAPSVAVTAGQSAQVNLSLTPTGGFDQSVALTCSGAPQGATCTVSPNPVALSGTAAVAATATITTTGRSVAPPAGRMGSPPLRPWARPEVIMLALLALGWLACLTPARRRAPRLAPVHAPLLAATMLALLLWASCGGSQTSGNPGTPPGTYTLTISGAAGSSAGQVVHAVDIVLKVN